MRALTLSLVLLSAACSSNGDGGAGGGTAGTGGGTAATGGSTATGGGSTGTGGGTAATGGGHSGTGGGSTAAGGGTAGTGGSGGGTCTIPSGGATTSIFSAAEPWTQDVSALPPSAKSSDIIAALSGLGGWGHGNVLQIDFSIIVLDADEGTPRESVVKQPNAAYCFGGFDCDPVPFTMPVPTNGNTEGSAGYSCDFSNNDCHVLVVEHDEHKLYELYNASKDNGTFVALGAFKWDLTKPYPDNERGDQCTSADAAGFPIAGLMVTADEVASGEIAHAIRFILPNDHMKAGVYVHPASHAGGPSATDPNAPPYGVHLRLKSCFDETPYTAPQKVVLHAMKRYGMFLSDGGNIALTFSDDRLSTHKWAQLGIESTTFNSIGVSNFEVVGLGSEIAITNDCVRNP